MYKCEYCSPVGKLIILSDGEYLTGLDFFDANRDYSDLDECNSLQIFDSVKLWLDTYFDGKIPNFTPKMKLCGTDFQREVWSCLREIPYGQTSTYGAIAKALAEKRNIARMSAQAVGNAIHRNPIAIIVPCHRVIGSNGSLIGYAGGLDRKMKLLNIEKSVTSQ